MRQKVTAIVVVKNDEATLQRTVAALAAQTVAAARVVLIDAGSRDASAELARRAATELAPIGALVAVSSVGTFASGIQAALRAVPALPADAAPSGIDIAQRQTAQGQAGSALGDEWLWLLTGNSIPASDALERMLDAVEVAPSVAIVGPKLVEVDDADRIRSFGVSVSALGRAMPLLESDVDQGQYDREPEVLGVELTGMLVRRRVWAELGGADAGLRGVDTGLDLSVRARLDGHRVERVAGARVGVSRREEDFGRKRASGPTRLARLSRSAQLHRRLAWAPGVAVPLHWLAILPLAVLRSLGHLLTKRLRLVPGEFGAALAGLVDGSVAGARSRIRGHVRADWPAIAQLRLSPREMRRRTVGARERSLAGVDDEAVLVRADLVGSGAIWMVVVVAFVGVAALWRLLGAPSISGGGALPLAPDLGRLWTDALSTARQTGADGTGPADPFELVLAVLGGLTFWAPSLSLVLLWLLAMPLSALGGWWFATRLSDRSWPPIVAAALVGCSPPLLVALADGRVGAVVACVGLPWLLLAGYEARRSWSAAAAAALLAAVVLAGAPALVLALAPLWLLWLVAAAIRRPGAVGRMLWMLLPTLVLFAPLATAQLRRGTPVALLADPGLPTPFAAPSSRSLLLALPRVDGLDLSRLAGGGAIGGVSTGWLLAVLLVPLALLVVIGLLVRGSARALFGLAGAALGLLGAWAVLGLHLSVSGLDQVGVWPGSALALYWLGLVTAATVGLQRLVAVGSRFGFGAGASGLGRGLRRTARVASPLLGGLALLATAITVLPWLVAGIAGDHAVRAGTGRVLPALVDASGRVAPGVGTLRLSPLADGSLAVELERGSGTTLDRTSSYLATAPASSAAQRRLAVLAANLAGRSGLDPTASLREDRIGFIVLDGAGAGAGAAAEQLRDRAAEALDASGRFESAGQTSDGTELWRVRGAAVSGQQTSPSAGLLPLAIVLGLTLLLAVPTDRRPRVSSEDSLEDAVPEPTGDDHDLD